MAAAGGLVLGLGVGLAIARLRERGVWRRVRQDHARLRASVVPVLEARAQQLGIPREERESLDGDPIALAVGLSVSIMRVEGDPNLAFSDTVQLARAELLAKKQKDAGHGG